MSSSWFLTGCREKSLIEFGENSSGNKEVVLRTYLNLNQVHYQNQFAKGSVTVEFGENWSGNKEVELGTVLNLKSGILSK